MLCESEGDEGAGGVFGIVGEREDSVKRGIPLRDVFLGFSSEAF